MFFLVWSLSISFRARTRLYSLPLSLMNCVVILRITREFGDVHKSQLIWIFERALWRVVLIVAFMSSNWCITHCRTCLWSWAKSSSTSSLRYLIKARNSRFSTSLKERLHETTVRTYKASNLSCSTISVSRRRRFAGLASAVANACYIDICIFWTLTPRADSSGMWWYSIRCLFGPLVLLDVKYVFL